MRALILAPVVVAVLAGSALAERLPIIAKGTEYAAAREALLKSGWQPQHRPDAQPCDDDDRCNGRPEMVSCAGTGAGNCLFAWEKGPTQIEVGTIHDLPPIVAGIRCRKGC